MLFLQSDVAKHRIASFTTDKIGELYGIPATIGSIEIKNLNEATLENVLILDLDGDTLIYARRAMASIEPTKLFDNRIQINTLAFESPDIRLDRPTKEAPLNIQFILDRISSDEKKENNTDLRINQLLVYDAKFKYDVENEKHITDKLDPNHISVNDFACNISLKNFNKESLNLYIRSISGVERSGLELDKFKAHIIAKENGVRLTDLLIELPGSNISSQGIEFSNLNDSLQQIGIDGELNCRQISFEDLSPILPKLSLGLPELSFDIKGKMNNGIAQGEFTVAASDNSFKLNGNTKVVSPHSDEREIEATVSTLFITEQAMEKLSSLYGGIPMDLPRRIGDTSISGNVFYSKDSLDGDAVINSRSGILNADLLLDSSGNYMLTANGNDIHLGRILDNGSFEECDVKATSKGNIRHPGELADFDIEVSSFRFLEYTYAPIRIAGKASKEGVDATLNTHDPNVALSATMEYRKEQRDEKMWLTLNVDSIIPDNLNLSDRYQECKFAFGIECDHTVRQTGKSITNIKMRDFVFNDGNGSDRLRNLHIYDDNTEEKRTITVNSDILKADLVGSFSLSSLHESFLRIANIHLPSFKTKLKRRAKSNNYYYRVEVKETRLLNKLLDLPFAINETSIITGSCLEDNNTFSVEANLNNIVAGGTQFRAINLKGSSDKGQIAIDANILKPTKKGKKELDYRDTSSDVMIGFRSTLHNDTINSFVDWSDITESNKNNGSVQVDLVLELDKRNKLNFDARIIPSRFTLNGQEWNITPGSIKGNGDRLLVNNLHMSNAEQSLNIDGVAGKFIDDCLNVEIKNLDVSTILGLTNFRVFKFGGRATGRASMTSVLHSLDVDGRFMIDSMLIDDAHMGNGDIGIGWMSYNSTLSLDCGIIGKEKTSRVSGFLSSPRDTMLLRIDANDLNIAFLGNKIDAFIGEPTGVANGTVYVLGKMRKLDLAGAAALDCSLKVKANNVTYNINGDTLYLRPNTLAFDDVGITDRYGNRGRLRGSVNHSHFSNWRCDLNIDAENMLVYDTNGFDNMPFYGTAFATGTANINSPGSGLYLKASMRSEPNSHFYYNSTSASGARDNSFVTFTDSKKSGTRRNSDTAEEKNNTYALVTSKLNLDFMLDITETFHIKVYTNLKTDDYIDFYGRGTINALYDEKNGFSMKGGLNLDRGTYKFTIQDIFPKEFKIENGSTLSFDGDPFRAGLDLKTKYLVPSASLSDLTTETTKNKTVKVNCVMDIGGTLESPALSFDLELPEGSEEEKELLASVASTSEQKNMQFIYLLGVGKFYTFDYNNTGNDSQSSTAMESLISNTLSGQLNNMLSQIIDNDNWDISGNFSTSERGWNRMEVEGMLRGRLLDNRLLINGNFGYKENPIANSNFIGDFEIQWLLNKKGNINLKAYSKTNDRYFSKTNLTTQGAGILFKFDFNKWRWWKKDEEQ
ncbi:MAG: translocation/assembly module TamB domain-containing protein [Bacteroidaceae bacterium]|nr:translocation/assembly module TamB domain-containing protein [Bacteroidaceae bacterium]